MPKLTLNATEHHIPNNNLSPLIITYLSSWLYAIILITVICNINDQIKCLTQRLHKFCFENLIRYMLVVLSLNACGKKIIYIFSPTLISILIESGNL